jgi:hypothetical protein
MFRADLSTTNAPDSTTGIGAGKQQVGRPLRSIPLVSKPELITHQLPASGVPGENPGRQGPHQIGDPDVHTAPLRQASVGPGAGIDTRNLRTVGIDTSRLRTAGIDPSRLRTAALEERFGLSGRGGRVQPAIQTERPDAEDLPLQAAEPVTPTPVSTAQAEPAIMPEVQTTVQEPKGPMTADDIRSLLDAGGEPEALAKQLLAESGLEERELERHLKNIKDDWIHVRGTGNDSHRATERSHFASEVDYWRHAISGMKIHFPDMQDAELTGLYDYVYDALSRGSKYRFDPPETFPPLPEGITRPMVKQVLEEIVGRPYLWTWNKTGERASFLNSKAKGALKKYYQGEAMTSDERKTSVRKDDYGKVTADNIDDFLTWAADQVKMDGCCRFDRPAIKGQKGKTIYDGDVVDMLRQTASEPMPTDLEKAENAKSTTRQAIAAGLGEDLHVMVARDPDSYVKWCMGQTFYTPHHLPIIPGMTSYEVERKLAHIASQSIPENLPDVERHTAERRRRIAWEASHLPNYKEIARVKPRESGRRLAQEILAHAEEMKPVYTRDGKVHEESYGPVREAAIKHAQLVEEQAGLAEQAPDVNADDEFDELVEALPLWQRRNSQTSNTAPDCQTGENPEPPPMGIAIQFSEGLDTRADLVQHFLRLFGTVTIKERREATGNSIHERGYQVIEFIPSSYVFGIDRHTAARHVIGVNTNSTGDRTKGAVTEAIYDMMRHEANIGAFHNLFDLVADRYPNPYARLEALERGLSSLETRLHGSYDHSHPEDDPVVRDARFEEEPVDRGVLAQLRYRLS